MLAQKLKSSEEETIASFQQAERQLDARARKVFYAGIGSFRKFINTKEGLDAFIQFLLKISPTASKELGDDAHRLFEGLPFHQYLMRPNTDIITHVERLYNLYLIILKKYSNQAHTIYEDIKTLIERNLVLGTLDLADVGAYLQEFSFLTPERYSQFISLDSQRRIAFLREHKAKYVAITLGEQTNITVEDYDLIWYAVNSKNLTKEIIVKTLERYGKEAAKLPPQEFTPFDIKDLSEVIGYKAKDLRKDLGKFLARISTVILEENYPYEKILRLLGQAGKNIPEEILALTKMQNGPVTGEMVNLAYGKAYNNLIEKNYLHDIAWILAVKYTADKDFGEDQKRELEQAVRLTMTDYENPTKEEVECILRIYNRLTELYNDTIKHHFNDEDFLQKIHQPKSQILLIGKELNKIIPITNKNKIHIRCYPSRNALDLFYGYYGENCTSECPQEIFNESFTAVRIIQMFGEEPTIIGCIHFYTPKLYTGPIHDSEGKELDRIVGKKILAILGVEPRSQFTNHSNPKVVFQALNEAIERQAKALDYDYVCYPEKVAMHSNQPMIASEIAIHIRKRNTIPLDIPFPKDIKYNYTTGKLHITWKR